MRPFLTVYGHVTIDQILTVDEFPQDNRTVDVTSSASRLGGTAANVAVVAASLGVPTALSAFVGTDFPAEYEESLRSSGLMLDELVKVDGCGTSRAIVVNDSKLNQRVLFHQGPQGHASSLGIVMTGNAERSEYTHFCTGEPRFTIGLMRRLKGRTKLAFDPAQEIHSIWNEGSFKEAMGYADILFSNQFEAESMLRYLGLDSFEGYGFPLVFVTKGADGCDVFADGKREGYPIVRARSVVDATGAGDAFRGGLYAGLYRGMSLRESIVTAAATASFIVESVGATANVPTWDMVMERADGQLRSLRCSSPLPGRPA